MEASKQPEISSPEVSDDETGTASEEEGSLEYEIPNQEEIRPYQFEPEADESDSTTDSEGEPDSHENPRRLLNIDWNDSVWTATDLIMMFTEHRNLSIGFIVFMLCHIPVMSQVDVTDPTCLTLDKPVDEINDCIDHFPNDEHIRCVNLSHNSLKDLATNLANCLPNLNEIDLSFNQYPQVPTRALAGLADLHYLQMDNNLIISLEGAFHRLGSLTRISFGSNQIGKIPTDMFRDLRQLKVAEFPNNNITVLPCFGEMKNLTISQIDLRNNKLTALNLDCIIKIENATTIFGNDSVIQVRDKRNSTMEFWISDNYNTISCENDITLDTSSLEAITLNISCRLQNGTRGRIMTGYGTATQNLKEASDTAEKQKGFIWPLSISIILLLIAAVLSICLFMHPNNDPGRGAN